MLAEAGPADTWSTQDGLNALLFTKLVNHWEERKCIKTQAVQKTAITISSQFSLPSQLNI